jgi:hypothetical protein
MVPEFTELDLADGSAVVVFEDGTVNLFLHADDEEPSLIINLYSLLADEKENEL